jgi:GTP-binding protein
MPKKPLVAIVGRPNVGKSTLFNRLVGERVAIVEDLPGTTRDRIYADVNWNASVFTIIDTGGLLLDAADEMGQHVRDQARLAIDEADAVVMVVDITDGLMDADIEIADVLRRSAKPIILAANKADNLKREMGAHEFHALGLGEPLCISAIRGLSTGELLDAITGALGPLPEEEEESGAVRVAIVGRTNVGKSSLLNRLVGSDRAVVSASPGTTRDAIDTTLQFEGQEVVLVDTAGIRRRGQIERGIEQYSVLRSLRAISRASVVLLVVDATAGITAQDTHVAGYILDEAKSVVVVVNKWDLLEKTSETQAIYEEQVRSALRFMPWVPILFVSALTGQRTDQILALALRIERERAVRLSTSTLNGIIREATARRSPPTRIGKKLRIYYGTQVGQQPPTFVFFVNDRRVVHFGYERYLENQIRLHYPYEGTPIRLVFRDHAEE